MLILTQEALTASRKVLALLAYSAKDIDLPSHMSNRYLTKNTSNYLSSYYKSDANFESGLVQQRDKIAASRNLILVR